MNAATHFRMRSGLALGAIVAALVSLAAGATGAAGGSRTLVFLSPRDGATVSGGVRWEITVSQGAPISSVAFRIDGTVSWTETFSPFVYNGDAGTLDTRALADGSHTLTATAVDRKGNAVATTNATVTVANGTVTAPTPPPPPPPTTTTPSATAPPTVTGSSVSGQTLTATLGTWAGTTPITYARAWERCSSTGCTAIAGATGGTYTLTSGDVGAAVRHSVTAQNAAGSGVSVSAQTAAVQPPASSTPAAGLGTALPARMPQSSGAGGTFFVDGTAGSDTNPGTSAAPWKTINKALSTVPLKGSVIKVRPGTYSSSGTSYAIVFNNRKGDPADPVTLTAETPGTVTIVNANPTAPTLGGWIINSTGLRIQGLTFRIVTDRGINPPWSPGALKIQNADRIEVTGCTFNEVGGGHIGLTGGWNAGEVSDDVWVVGNLFRPSGGDPYAQMTGLSYAPDNYFGSKGAHYLYMGAYGDTSKPEYWSGSERLVVANNVFVGTAAGRHVQLGSQARHSFVVGNTFFGNHAGDVLGWNTIPNGAQYAGEAVLLFANLTDTFASSNNVVKNNLMVDLNGHAVYGGTVSMAGNLVEKNMSFDTDNGKGYNDDPNDAFDNTYGSAVVYSKGVGNTQNVNPLLANPAGYDFRLGAGSPAVGKADPAYSLPYDYAGRSRDGAPDLGALEQ